MNDVAPSRYKWVGTRPIRPDGVPKVTGRAMYAADMAMPGALYGKIVMKSSKYHAHDEKGEYHTGDVIEITESKPISKTKNWVATRLVEKAVEV